MRALVIDEDPAAAAALVTALRARGHDVVEHSSTEAGLQAHARSPFPLVVIAWRKVNRRGLAACQALRALPGGASPVVLVATDRDEHNDHQRGLEAGADDFLVGSPTAVELATRIAIGERMVIERARRELTEEALLSSEASFRALIEGSPDAIVTYRDGRIVYVNPALLRALDYDTGSQLVGRAFLDLVHPEDAPGASTRIDSVLTSGLPTAPREVRLRTRAGESVVMEEIGIPLEFDGAPAVAAVLRDLSERKQMEQRLAMADRMVSVGTLAAGIAHEINNPLTYVLTNLSLISEEIESLHDTAPAETRSALRELIAQADDGAERVRVIVRDLKTFSRADDDSAYTADIHAVIEGAVSMAWNEIRHRATLERHYGELPATCGTEAKLGQVFLNLLVNAAQSLPVGRADEHRITIRSWMEPDWAFVSVSDTGHGIAEPVQRRIFDPFFTTKPVGVGVGLGLSICHNIVQAAGGDLTFRSHEDDGTTFLVKLPLAPEHQVAETSPPPSGASPTQTSDARVLIIDDEPSIARALQRSLRNYDVTTVLSGREALQLLQGPATFDVIFCDLMMSEVTGMDLYREVCEGPWQHADRFVFMTGGAFTQRAQDFVAHASNPVIQKPFDIKEVQSLVANHRIRLG